MTPPYIGGNVNNNLSFRGFLMDLQKTCCALGLDLL